MTKEQKALALGIDLGGSKILSAVVDARGNILSRDYSVTPATEGLEAVVKSVLESADRALRQANISVANLSAIGICAPGPSNPETGILFTSPNLPALKDVPLRDIIGKALGKPVFLLNDADAAALGELYFGAGRSARNFIYITVSTGIGGGIIIDGKVYHGASGVAGEVGHIVIDDDGPPCGCGNHGCWETLASGTALAREAKKRIDSGVKTSILEYAGGTLEKVNAEAVHRAARAGDNLAVALIRRNAYYLGVGLANLINIFNPELIVIGGGLSNLGDLLLKPASEEAGRRAFRQSYQAVRIVRAELGSDSGVIGAASFALEEVIKG
ncbi:MAG: ROK family protein [Chloroflexi bacterium]|nr:ROK family protein [Chloroflexota bacterium]